MTQHGPEWPPRDVPSGWPAMFPIAEPRTVAERVPSTADFVLIGDATHGTHEMYELRGEVTKVLIRDHQVHALAVEADFPEAFRVNMYVRGYTKEDADEALSHFKGFPEWLWRNAETKSFIKWLHDWNAAIPADQRRLRQVGFYGMDLYSLTTSTEEVVKSLRLQGYPLAADYAAQRYTCFSRFGADALDYAKGLAQGEPDCEVEAIEALLHIVRGIARRQPQSDDPEGREEEGVFATVANAVVVRNAERYYRNMFFKKELTWNIRDSHMADVVASLYYHLQRRGINRPRIIVWAHAFHVCDARACDMYLERGEVNLGQLLREAYGLDQVFSIELITHTGTVAAADEWGHPVRKMGIRHSAPGSYERLFHAVVGGNFGAVLRGAAPEAVSALVGPRTKRGIGVIYKPYEERALHYFKAWLPWKSDMILHLDRTSALEPMDPHPGWEWLPEDHEDLPEVLRVGL